MWSGNKTKSQRAFSPLYFSSISFSLTLTVWLSGLEHVQNLSFHAPCASRLPHPLRWTSQLGINFGWIPCSSCSLKYSNSATELPSDSVAQLVRAWQAIWQVTGTSPSLSHSLFSSLYFLSLFLTFRPLWLWLWFKIWLSGLEYV